MGRRGVSVFFGYCCCCVLLFDRTTALPATVVSTTRDQREEGPLARASGVGPGGDYVWWRNDGAADVDAAAASGWRARGRRRDGSEAGGLATASARRGMAEVEMAAGEGADGAGGLSDGDEELARQRDYLNGLVTESASKTRGQACNVAFAKTHKTASTTLAMILVRYARRHDKKLASFGGPHVSAIPLDEAVEQIHESGQRVDVMHYHYTISGTFKGRWEEATSMYKEIMQDGERISYVTVVRNHREHFLSYYYYYVQPEVQLSVAHFFQSNRKDDRYRHQRGRLSNPLCSEFGIRTEEELEHFIQSELPDFRLVILTEAFDEGLMVLRRLMGWEMIDMTYSRMMETKSGSRRWDGKYLKNVPHFDDLNPSVQKAIDDNTALDSRLYEAASMLYEERKAVAAIEIEAELEEFEKLQAVMNGYLQKNSSSEAVKWYSGGVQPYLGGPPFRPF